MTAISEVTTVAAPAPRSASPRPGIAVAVRVELAKLSGQWPLRITLGLCVIVPAGRHPVRPLGRHERVRDLADGSQLGGGLRRTAAGRAGGRRHLRQ
jgi:hypothetical protein